MIIQYAFPSWLFQPAWPLDRQAAAAAKAHQDRLTKPAGSLGELENIAERFAAWQGRTDPHLERIIIRVFAGDHGICAHEVSAFPQEVTVQMIDNFLHGGAAISVMARRLGAELEVHNVGTVTPVASRPGLVDCTVMSGTRDFTQEPAMSTSELTRALAAGAAAVPDGPVQVFIGGEMGIGNSTSAAALVSVLLDVAPERAVGPGTGVDSCGLARKCRVVERALELHGDAISRSENPALTALTCLGGLEIAALVGAYVRCAQRGVGILVDGFIATTAALCAVKINPQVRDWMLFGHLSREPAHRIVLKKLGAIPLLNLGMRLGEGSGAAVAVPVLQAALALHNNMATFDSAGVSGASIEPFG